MAQLGQEPPHDDGLTERSKKFYDGTYKWDYLGFTDDHGVYREWGEGPLSAPPTPKPPRFSSEPREQVFCLGNGIDDEGIGSDMLAAEPRTPGPSGMLDENGDDQDNVAGVVGAIPVVSTPAPEVPIHPRLNGNLSSDRLEMGANAPRHDIADAEPHDPQLGEFRTGVLYARGAITLEDARRRLGLASADTITRALALLNNMKDGLPTNTRSRPLVSPARNGILGQIMEQHPSARSEDKEAQINALREKGSSQTETAAIGEPNGPLLSPMSAVTDLSDPPSDITEPSEITAKLSGTSVVDASSKAQLNTKEAPSSQAARKDNIASVPTKNKEHSSKPAVSDPPAVSEKPAGKKKLTLKLKNTYSNKRKRNDTHENPLTSDIRNPNPTFPVDTAAEPPQGPPQKKQAIARAVRPMVIDENYDDEEDQAAEEPVLPAVPFGEDSGSDYASRKKKPKGGKKIAKAPRKSKTASTTRKSSSVGKKGSKSETPAPAPAPTRRSIRLMK